MPRALIASVFPSGDGAEKNSFVKRSALTGIGVPPSGETRYTSLMLLSSCAAEEK